MATGPAREAHIQDLAHHFLQSGDLRRALDYSLRAGERARRLHAHDEALTYFQHAADCAETLSLPDQMAHIHEALGDIQALRGLQIAAVDHFQQALALAETREARAAIKTKIGTAYGQFGDARGLEFLQTAQGELDPVTQQDELAHTLTMLGRYHHYRGQHAQAIDYYERARALAEPLDNPLTLTYLYAYLAGAYQHMARYEDSMRWARQCLALGERKDFPFAQAAGYEFMAEDLMLIGRWHEAIDYARRDRQVGERMGSPERLAWAEFARGWSLLGLGELTQAREATLFSQDIAEQIGESRLLIWLGGLLSLIETDLDHGGAAQAAAQDALKKADSLEQVILQCWCRSGLAYLHIARGEWRAALDLCRQGAALYTPTDNLGARVMIGSVAPQAYLGAGRLDDAEQAVSEQLARTRETGSLHAKGVALRTQGQILAAQQRWDEAARAFDEAIAQLDELDSRLELGRALQQRAALRRAIGQPELARADAEQACALFEACEAPRDAENARSLLPTLS
jgi:tetratricopeptide (TPR) repeat protein